jgi:biopolymer transport protein ExbD
MNKPSINVTPLIDVLLVLLIIFMIASPLRPESFKTRVPQTPTSATLKENPLSLVITISKDGVLSLNNEKDIATAAEPSRLISRLKQIFLLRAANRAISERSDPAFPSPDGTERTVFIKAPSRIDYGTVAHVVDAAKSSGAVPISLQIDGLD